MWSILANPHRFMGFSRYAVPVCYVIGTLLFGWAMYQALWVVPPDAYQGGDIIRAMFIHVPSAWLCMGLYLGLAVSSFVWFIWRHELADIAARAIAPVGAGYTALCLATGSIWGKPTWGTWWLWDDARMMSVLVLFFLFIGYMALRAAMETRQKAARAGAILAMVGAINVPLIKFAVDIWSSLHQGPSVIRAEGPAMAMVYLNPLLISFLGQSLIVAAMVFTLMRAEVFGQQADALMARRLGEG
ncbi:MAG: heme ABC transporter permease CcmC [Henriciella sp.]|nr:heme ABC transporter permease CcmC [Henriciella sp.]